MATWTGCSVVNTYNDSINLCSTLNLSLLGIRHLVSAGLSLRGSKSDPHSLGVFTFSKCLMLSLTQGACLGRYSSLGSRPARSLLSVLRRLYKSPAAIYM